MNSSNLEATPTKTQSILKKTLSHSSLKTPNNKNVKFNSKVDVSQFFSTPWEKNHEILVNPKSQSSGIYTDEFIFKSTETSINQKSAALEEELRILEMEIARYSNENMELNRLIDSEREEFKAKGYGAVSDAALEKLVLQNKTLQELVAAKSKENEGMRKNLQDPQGLGANYEKKLRELNVIREELERQYESMRKGFEAELRNFKVVSQDVFTDDFRKELERELQKLEEEIMREKDRVKNFEEIKKFDREEVTLENLVLVYAEFDRLNSILSDKRAENNEIEMRLTGIKRDLKP